MSESIVITGMGAVTPLGGTLEESWERLLLGTTVRRPVSIFETEGCRCHEAAEVDLQTLPEPRVPQPKRLSRSTRLAIPALESALESASLLSDAHTCVLPEVPLSLSTTGAGMAFGEEFVRRIEAKQCGGLMSVVARYQAQQQVLDLQRYFGMRGHSMTVENACASGANAIGHGADLIRAGMAECVVCGGYEALTELIYTGFDCLQALSTTSCKPFDINRDGLMLGEAAAFFVLESESHAQKRGVPVICELAGYGHSTDVHHLTQPAPDGAALIKAMKQAAGKAGIAASEISYLNAHGTATPMNDGAEVLSYLGFWNTLDESLKISSTKAAIGHTLGAAGVVEAAFTICALREGKLPPQVNTSNPIEAIRSSLVAAGECMDNMRYAMSVNLGFGGSNAALIFKK